MAKLVETTSYQRAAWMVTPFIIQNLTDFVDFERERIFADSKNNPKMGYFFRPCHPYGKSLFFAQMFR
jgi:hypothetical protein